MDGGVGDSMNGSSWNFQQRLESLVTVGDEARLFHIWRSRISSWSGITGITLLTFQLLYQCCFPYHIRSDLHIKIMNLVNISYVYIERWYRYIDIDICRHVYVDIDIDTYNAMCLRKLHLLVCWIFHHLSFPIIISMLIKWHYYIATVIVKLLQSPHRELSCTEYRNDDDYGIMV